MIKRSLTYFLSNLFEENLFLSEETKQLEQIGIKLHLLKSIVNEH